MSGFNFLHQQVLTIENKPTFPGFKPYDNIEDRVNRPNGFFPYRGKNEPDRPSGAGEPAPIVGNKKPSRLTAEIPPLDSYRRVNYL